MLEELLNLIRTGGVFDIGLLAKKLNSSEQMVRTMIDHLQQMGLIQAYQPGHAVCAQCNLGGNCYSCNKGDLTGNVRLFEVKLLR